MIGNDLKQTAYPLDATVIDLCLATFPWARFRKRKGAIKLHTLLDLRCNFSRISANPIDKSTGLRCDQIIRLTGFYAAKDYPDTLRRIKYYDAGKISCRVP